MAGCWWWVADGRLLVAEVLVGVLPGGCWLWIAGGEGVGEESLMGRWYKNKRLVLSFLLIKR